uniref:Uncharacterized protein n=1 Tax=Knipowitschia caucasica TaxID=637954 RepID=A0AAV2KY91_KNICA
MPCSASPKKRKKTKISLGRNVCSSRGSYTPYPFVDVLGPNPVSPPVSAPASQERGEKQRLPAQTENRASLFPPLPLLSVLGDGQVQEGSTHTAGRLCAMAAPIDTRRNNPSLQRHRRRGPSSAGPQETITELPFTSRPDWLHRALLTRMPYVSTQPTDANKWHFPPNTQAFPITHSTEHHQSGRHSFEVSGSVSDGCAGQHVCG